MATIHIKGCNYATVAALENPASGIRTLGIFEPDQIGSANTILSNWVGITQRIRLAGKTKYTANGYEVYHDTQGRCSIFFYVTGGDSRTFTDLYVVGVAQHIDGYYDFNWVAPAAFYTQESTFPKSAAQISERKVF